MLAHREETSQESDSDTHDKSDRKQDLVYSSHRQKVYDVLQDTESRHHILYSFVIQEIQQRQRNRSAEHTNDQTFDHER